MKKLGITLTFIAMTFMCGTVALGQVAGGPGVVVAVHDNGTVTVRIGDQEQTVYLPNAQLGDKVVCTATNDHIKWKCRLRQD